MNKTVRNLLVLLAVQCAMIFVFSTKENSLVSFTPNEPLINIQSSEVTKLEIEQNTGEDSSTTKKISLIKDGESWKIAEAENFPADPVKMQTRIDKIAGLKKSFPVGTTDIAARQLKTSPTEFEKKLTMSQGEKKQILYLGTSPTFKKVHASVDGDRNTYAVDLITYELSTNVTDWFNKSFFVVPRDKIKNLKVGDIELKLENNIPKIDGLDDTQELDVEKANSLISEIETIRFTDLATKEQEKTLKEKKESFAFSIEKSDNITDTFQFIDGDTAEEVFMKLVSQPYYVKVTKSKIDDIKKVSKDSLIKSKKQKTEISKSDSEVSSGDQTNVPSVKEETSTTTSTLTSSDSPEIAEGEEKSDTAPSPVAPDTSK